ncbi:hypothetical protein EVAR_46554_1 [Eumeta japonica]|uniref:Syndetin n=1 Tax=Eumeta variegata TaxID=151549 RepID=A0A4C1XR00_EUMVA|nr:hypothetical protein EVAR_46554_1 [Eumeta japonica]
MLSSDMSETRHGPPGVNSRSLSAVHSAADLQVLREIDHVYFSSVEEFDAARHALENAPQPPDCAAIENMFTRLKRQQQVVSGKALHLISQQRDNCDREFAEIQNMRKQLDETIKICKNARAQLNTSKDDLAVSTLIILANYRKRQSVKSVLQALDLLRGLRSIETDVSELMTRKDFEGAISLILNSIKNAEEHKEYSCIKELTNRLQDTLVLTEEQLDGILSKTCYNFDEKIFEKLRKAYTLLGKTQVAMEQLHMHYSSAINESAFNSVKKHVKEDHRDVKFQDLCQSVPLMAMPDCLLDLCESLFMVMRSYYLLVNWYSKNEESVENATNVVEIERNVSKEYIRQKLKSGLMRIWVDVQVKVSTLLENSSVEEFPFEKFILMLGILRKLTQIAEVFCGDKSDILQGFIKTHSVTYIKNYHRGRMEELKLFLENEGWEPCPVKPAFTLLNLQEFRPFKKYITLQCSDLSMVNSKSHSDVSSANSQEDSVYIKRFFSSKTKSTPFEIFRNENTTNDDIFGLEAEAYSDSDDEPEELKRDFVDEGRSNDYTNFESKESPMKTKSVIVTNTTLSVLRNCGQYLQICRYLPQIALEVVMFMNQLFDYYFYTVHLFFTSDLEVGTSTLYTQKLNAALKRIGNSIDSTVSPTVPDHLDLTSEEYLHGLTERIVAVESVIFLSKQFDMLQPYLESIVSPHQKMILELYKTNTLAICTDLRNPIYMCTASKSLDTRNILVAISSVKWDVKSVAVEHSNYVDVIIRQVQVFALRLENISCRISMNMNILNSVWSMVSKFIVHLLVEGYSNVNKCSNAGRGLMQLDYRQLFEKLEKISGLKPVPYQDYIDKYVKAYYLPRSGLEDFVKTHSEYSNKHLLALVTCACENKRDRQELSAIIEGKEL